MGVTADYWYDWNAGKVLATEEQKNIEKIKLHPNPARDILSIKTDKNRV